MGSTFTIKEIRSLLEMLEKFEVSEFRLERADEKLWLKRGAEGLEGVKEQAAAPVQQVLAPMPVQASQQPAAAQPSKPPEIPQVNEQQAPVSNPPQPGQAPQQPQAAPAPQPAAPERQVVAVQPSANGFREVNSPMVGTFYRRPAVDAEPYVEVGDTVKKGDVLCIVEAMKLMNEIESDIAGTIVEICLEDGQMVEYGEVLFKIQAA